MISLQADLSKTTGLNFVQIKHNVSLEKSGHSWVNFMGRYVSNTIFSLQHSPPSYMPLRGHSAFHYDPTSSLMLSVAISNCF